MGNNAQTECAIQCYCGAVPNLSVNKNGLTSEQAEAVTQTLSVVGANIERITPNFYNRMFATHPELIADTFNHDNQKQGVQQETLAASVTTSAATLVGPDTPVPEELLSRIGHKHISVDIKPEQYPIVHRHLFDAIGEILTPEVFQGAVRDAWDTAYLEMQRILINFEKGLYDDLDVEADDVFRAAHVVSREERDNDATVFSVKSDYESPVSYPPGQYISVRQTMPDGVRQLRQYFLVGGREGVLTFAARRVDASGDLPAGEVSTQLQEKVQSGDTIETSLPVGDLVLDMKSNDLVVLTSASIGATPMTDMLDTLVATDSKRGVVALHADRAEAADALRAKRDNAVAALANARQQVWYESDLMDLTDVDLPEGAQYYLCGGNDSLQTVRKQLVNRGVDRNNVHFELFSPNDWLLDV